jgi:uncharacterized protein YndB with AHSA1/START domain
MMLSELSRIDRTIVIKAPPERVWRALTDPAQVSQWFGVTIEGSIAQGSEAWMTSLHPDYAGQRFRVRFTEMTPPRRLVWRWHPGAVDPKVDYSREPETTVTFTLEPSDGGTRLTVAETGFDEIILERRAKVYADNSQGWTEVLASIQKHVEATR